VKALVVSLSILFIGRLHFSEICNIPSIGYEETKVRKGSNLTWNILFIGTARFGASTSRRCIGVPNKERSAVARAYICEKGLWKDSLPAAYTLFIGTRAVRPQMHGFRPTWRSLFIGINRFECLQKRMSRTVKLTYS